MEKIIAAIVAAIISIITALFGGGAKDPTAPTTTRVAPTTAVTTTAPSTTDISLGNAKVYENYKYGADPTRQVLDLYIPANAKGEVGLVLYIHGGFWMAGDKSIFSADAKKTCRRGYCGATISYRYASYTTHMNDLLDDVASAASAIKSLAASQGVTINKMIVVGHSAGAHLAMMYGYTRANSSPIKPVAVWDRAGPTNLADDMWKAGGSGIYQVFTCITGTYITEDNFSSNAAQLVMAQHSPIAYANSAIPTIISHGVKDRTVPYENGVTLYQYLSVAGKKVAAFTYPNSDHGLESDASVEAQARQTLYQWAQSYMGSPVI